MSAWFGAWSSDAEGYGGQAGAGRLALSGAGGAREEFFGPFRWYKPTEVGAPARHPVGLGVLGFGGAGFLISRVFRGIREPLGYAACQRTRQMRA